jgi:hypothetical protein
MATPAIRQIIVAIGAMLNRWSKPIPANVPPITGTKALQVVSSAVKKISMGAEIDDGDLVVRLCEVFVGSCRGDSVITVL